MGERQGVSEEYLHPGISQRLYLVMYCSVIMWEVIKRIKSAQPLSRERKRLEGVTGGL